MPSKPRPLGNKASKQVGIATDHLRHGAALITKGLTLADRHPDTAAAHFRNAREQMVMAENILLRLKQGEFADD